jgi:hypothetical protein
VAVAAAARYKAVAASSRVSSSSIPAPQQQQQQDACVVSLPLSGGFFLLNPDGDLQGTQDTFQGWLQQQLGLQVSAELGQLWQTSCGHRELVCWATEDWG